MNIPLDPFAGAVSKGKVARYVGTRSQDWRERWVIVTAVQQDFANMESQSSHYGVPVARKCRIGCEEYDALRVGIIKLSFVKRSI